MPLLLSEVASFADQLQQFLLFCGFVVDNYTGGHKFTKSMQISI